MFNRLSIFQLLMLALLITGIVPLVVTVLLAGDVVAGAVGAALLVVLGLVMAFGVARHVTHPLQHIKQTGQAIITAVEAERADDITPLLAHFSRLDSVQEIDDLNSSFEQVVRVLQQRMVESNSVYAMGQAITANVDFEQTVEAVVAAVGQVVIFDAAEVAVRRGEQLVVEAWQGQPDFNDTRGRRYEIGRGPTGTIAANQAAVLVSTLSGEEDLRRTLGYESAAGEFLAKTHKVVINSFLGIPLVIGDRLIGTLTLVHREPGHFNEADRRQLEKLSAQASIAIENALQVRQRENVLKQQIRELRVEIDEARIHQQVEEITGTDYFQTLRESAAEMRKRVYTRRQRDLDEPGSETR